VLALTATDFYSVFTLNSSTSSLQSELHEKLKQSSTGEFTAGIPLTPALTYQKLSIKLYFDVVSMASGGPPSLLIKVEWYYLGGEI